MEETYSGVDSSHARHLIELIRDYEDFQGAVRKVNTGQKPHKGGFERRLQFWYFFEKNSFDTQIVLNFAYVRIPYRFSQKETLISSKEPPGTSIRPQNKTKIQTNKNLSTLVSRLFERLSVLDFSHAKVLIKSLRDNKAVKGAVRYAKQRSRNGQNQPIKLFLKVIVIWTWKRFFKWHFSNVSI